MKQFWEKRKQYILLGFEIVILAMLIFNVARPRRTYEVNGDEMNSAHGIYLENFPDPGENGIYLDNSLVDSETAEEEDLKIYSNKLTLPAGSYEVTLHYLTTENDMSYSAVSDYNTYPVTANHTSVELDPGSTEEKYIFCSPIRVTGYQVAVRYSGNGYVFVSGVEVSETENFSISCLFYGLIIITLINLIFWNVRFADNKWTRKQATIAAVLGMITFLSCVPQMNYYLYEGHDLSFHLNRIEAIYTSWQEGQFPARFSHFWGKGYGYSTSLFYGELFLYIPAAMRALGYSVQCAYKSYIVLLNLSACLIAFVSFRKVLKENVPALLACAVYVLNPYRLECIYQRAAVGESTAMTFYPLIVWGLFAIYTDEAKKISWKAWIPLTAGYCGLIQCHIISTVEAGIFTLIIALVLFKKTFKVPRLLAILKAAGLALLLNIWFLLPFAEMYATLGNGKITLGRFASNGVYGSQLFNLFPAGKYISASVTEGNDSAAEMPYSIGAACMAAAALYLLLRIYWGRKAQNDTEKIALKAGDMALGIGTLALAMVRLIFPWDMIQQWGGIFKMITANIQFPWRILSVAAVSWSLLAGVLTLWIRKEKAELFLPAVIALIVLGAVSTGYFESTFTESTSFHHAMTEEDLEKYAIGGEFLREGVEDSVMFDTSFNVEDGLELTGTAQENGVVTLDVVNTTDTEKAAEIPELYYKHYQAWDTATGDQIPVMAGESGKLSLAVPAGFSGTIEVRYVCPVWWHMCEVVSLITLIATVVCCIWNNKKEKIDDLQTV